METLGQVDDMFAEMMEDAQNGQLVDKSKISDQINDGIKESKKVSDQFLAFIHPEMNKMYQQNFIGIYKLVLKNIGNTDIENLYESDQEINDKMLTYWAFIQANQDEINKKLGDVEKKPKKSYWRMLLRLIIADFVSTIVFSFFIIALLLPFTPVMAFANKSTIAAIILFPFMAIASIGQTYFWILWASFCAFTVTFYVDSPDANHAWLYYITGFFFTTGPIGWFAYKESQSAQTYEEHKGIQMGTTYYGLIVIAAYIIFCIWTNLMDYKFLSWINDWLY